jgi:hypothetical protein
MSLLGAVMVLAGCGGEEVATGEPTPVASVKECLEDKGMRVQGGTHTLDPDDTDAPERGALTTEGALIAFYSSSERADALEGRVRENSAEAGGEVARYGDVTVVYLSSAKRSE